MKFQNRALRLGAFATLAFLAAFAAPVHARDRIREIEVLEAGVPLEDADEILGFAGLETGREYDPDRIARAVRQLLDSGRFSRVQVAVEPLGEDLRLRVNVRRRPRLSAPVEVIGNDRFNDDRIREWLELDPGDFVDEQILEARAMRLVREYEKAGFPDSRIDARVLPGPGNSARAEVTIEEGPRIKPQSVVVEGVHAIPASEIKRITGGKRWWNPFSWFGWFGPGVRDELETESMRLAIRDLYLRRGYLDAEVTGPRVSDDYKTLRFTVTEGPLYQIGRMEVRGSEDFPPDRLERLLPPLVGQPASRENIEAGETALREHYGAHGYADTRLYAETAPLPEAPDKVLVRYRIREGFPATVRRVEIRGNSRTRDKVVRRELLLKPGDKFNEMRVRRSERRLRNMGFFENVRSYDLPGPFPDQRDLVFDLEEKRTGQFMVGAGFSSTDRVLGFLELSQGNFDIANWPYFTGGGQKMRLSLQAGERRNSFSIAFTEPWFMDRRLALSVEAYRRERSYSEFDDRRTGGSVGLTRGVRGIGRVGLRYTLERVEMLDMLQRDYVFADAPDRSFRFDDQDPDSLVHRLRINWSDDTRDRWFVPTRGRLFSAFAGVSGGADYTLYETGLSFRQYVPLLFGHVLSLKGRWETVESFDGDFVPLVERLYIGGGRTLRGFEYRDVGPKVVNADPALSDDYRPIGGQSMAAASAEYSVPVLGTLRLAGFCDAGNAWENSFDFDPSDLAISAGVGVRIDIPGFPIRIDYAWPIRYDDDFTEESRWNIWIGYD